MTIEEAYTLACTFLPKNIQHVTLDPKTDLLKIELRDRFNMNIIRLSANFCERDIAHHTPPTFYTILQMMMRSFYNQMITETHKPISPNLWASREMVITVTP